MSLCGVGGEKDLKVQIAFLGEPTHLDSKNVEELRWNMLTII
jgi:hypothetical protein